MGLDGLSRPQVERFDHLIFENESPSTAVDHDPFDSRSSGVFHTDQSIGLAHTQPQFTVTAIGEKLQLGGLVGMHGYTREALENQGPSGTAATHSNHTESMVLIRFARHAHAEVWPGSKGGLGIA